ncbi:MAG: DNA-binding response regulator [Gammaproteobacteria bacterium CG_4_10_14_0_8_um_filter_38_16]|nr:MAG: DNA-binding response regulator [Gammaproteobacteria bacterium CG_4_10_14_0_8_um_filter_38_16]PJA02999.1 MAG: DNA-binding response regulator [Gammaproteobacteria bacterium CG_4_10_14_0_2_um_filter_38_22]PJB09710.1 MAG: DNA-binding response regulator [Gammaproteobacteria bacterium CG_4_9_14_3_um_filter_38_9]
MGKSILLVEDNQKLANFIKNSLVQAGYEVEVEGRGDKAAYRIVKEAPDLVVLDIMLPEMDGKQICHTVRNEYRGKILMLTALNDIESEVSSLNLGADDYLAKPVAEAVLIAHIAALFRRPNLSEPADQIKLGTLHIDLIKKITYLAGVEIELKPTDFELLLLLAKNADYTLNRDNIMYTLRGREYDGVDRSIDLRISNLRKKLGDNAQKPYKIKSVHGKGYIFISSAWESR